MSAPIRNSRRLRISPTRVASPSATFGVMAGLLATLFLFALLRVGRFDAAAGLGDRLGRTLGGADALQCHGLLQLARQHHLGLLGEHADHAGLLQRREVDDLGLDAVQLGQAHLGARGLHRRTEADLRHATLQRHLAALEADLVVAALARALALHAAAAGLALAGGSAATDAQPRLLRAGTRLDGIELHHFASSTFSRWIAVLIMPRFSAVSATTTEWCRRRRPRPFTDEMMLRSSPKVLFSCVTRTDFVAMCTYPRMSSTDLPRFAAMSSGERRPASAPKVARTTLIGLREP